MTSSSSDTLELSDLVLIVSVSGVTTLNVFLSGALTVALPTIGKEPAFKQSDLQWPLNVYAQQPAFAPSSGAFIAFVAAMGLGAAANTPSGLGLFSAFFPPGPKRNKAYGVLGAGQPLGFILGLILGGILAESKATWRAVFYIQSGLGVFFVVLGFLFLVKQPSTQRYTKGLDWGGALLSAAGIGLLTYSLADSTTAPKGWSTPQIPSLFAASIRSPGPVGIAADKNLETAGGEDDQVSIAIQSLFGGRFLLTLVRSYQQVNQLDPLQTARENYHVVFFRSRFS
ncbi:major facilitator superfamily-domain-containing protein [Mycena olivaceomarginata]|nr:major facilitator superfamily-domain-containing protein [Mycena olivaceomarginata]